MKRTYHSDVIFQYKLGVLSKAFLKEIPSSTLYNWRKKDINELFGLKHVYDFNDGRLEFIKEFIKVKELLKAAKAIYLIYKTYAELLEGVKNKKKFLYKSKNAIIKTIEETKDVLGFKRTLRAFGISYQQFYAWKRKTECKLSRVVFCRKLSHNQLTTDEVDKIKDYLKKPKYKNWSLSPVYFQILRDKTAFFSKASFYKYVNLYLD